MAEHSLLKIKPTRGLLWCAPRSTSTVLTKCLSAIDGMAVYLELYSQASSCRGYFSMSTGRDLPMELVGNEVLYDEANDLWEKNVGYRMGRRKISYQTIKEDLENASRQYVLAKEMAINSIDPKYFPEGFKHIFLIRDPSRVFTSARNVAGPKFAEIGMISSEAAYDLIRDDPIDSQPLKWFEKQHQLWKYVKANIDPNPVVIDASDVVSRPGPTIMALCNAVGFPYSEGLLQLKPLTEIPKNFVTAGENSFKKMSEFYERAFKSTHFVSSPDHGPIPRDQLSDDVIRCAEYSMPFYKDMFESRLSIPH